MAKRKRIELVFEGNPLVAVKLTERKDGNLLREILLSNGRQVRFLAVSEPSYPGSYSATLYAGKGARSVILNSRTSLELHGLEHGAKALIAVDPSTGEILIHRR